MCATDPLAFQSYFVHPTSNKEPVLFHVTRLRDGRGYCTRQVRATQGTGSHVVFIAICSFARAEPHQTLEHGLPMPKPELSFEEAVPAEVKLDQLAETLSNMMAGRKKRSSTMVQMMKQVKEGAKERRRMPIEIRNAYDNTDDLLLAEDAGNRCAHFADSQNSQADASAVKRCGSVQEVAFATI